MATVSLRLGDLVWGKLGRYPPWPGKIVNPPKDLKKPRGKKCFFVKFFGTEDHAWIKVEQLKPYHAHKEEMIKINKGKRFQQAVDAVEEFLRRAKGKDQTSSHTSADDKNRRNSSEERSRPNSGDEKRKLSLSEGKVKKNMGEGKKRVSSGSSERGSKSPLKRAQEQSPRKRGRPPKDEKDLTIPESSTVKGVMAGPMAAFKWQPTVSEPVKDADPHFHHFLLSQTEKPAVCYQAITKKLKICEEETGSTSIQAADSTAVNGSITPTDKKSGADTFPEELLRLLVRRPRFENHWFSRPVMKTPDLGPGGGSWGIGFLGLGLMGSGIVSNLLKMGHTVTVWNRTAEKEGARLGRTPAEVVSTCDITFACVSDPKAAKDLVLGPSGVLQGIRPGKCYVDMSTVDADTVTELAQVIVSRGGRFLEAPVSGNQQLSNDGMLVILAAGDRGLYEDCSSCFQAMGKTSFFLGEVGNAAKMMLIVNMVQGSFMATIAEGLTLAQVTGQSQQTLLDILNQGQLASIFLDQKCQNILQGNFKPDFYLKYIQKDLRLAIALGDAVNHPTPMAAAANEVYKRAKALDQSDNDMSAVYRAYIH
ncbi:cytokine-like nuclear factor N-PAC isoform X3 [Phacochoerus africanus]|uniref:cytokine-like nuclear factor N-PAC isoform X3 n=1 Tax=Phacochoerus africanus TaxID=41426 RepID=UPI001FD92C3E|nr:cytokine-like nuclear factor N-PAC isoform X3 [Phacochoerus africanus]